MSEWPGDFIFAPTPLVTITMYEFVGRRWPTVAMWLALPKLVSRDVLVAPAPIDPE